MTTLHLKLPTPPSVNNLTFNAGKRRPRTTIYKAWITKAGKELAAQRIGAISGPVNLKYVCPENARRDLGNYEKPMTDLLVAHAIIDGDRFRTVKKIHMEWHKEKTEQEVHVFVTGIEQ